MKSVVSPSAKMVLRLLIVLLLLIGSGARGASPPTLAVVSAASTASTALSLDSPAPAPLAQIATRPDLAVSAADSRWPADPLFVVRANHGEAIVRTTPSTQAARVSGLYYDTYLPVFAQAYNASNVLWYAVRLWGVVPGWIRADQTTFGDPPPSTPTAEAGPASARPAPGLSAPIPLYTTGTTNDLVYLRVASNAQSTSRALLAPGTTVHVWAWQPDGTGSPWYQVTVGQQAGWIWSGGVDLNSPQPSMVVVDGQPIWAPIAGKGMWLPAPLLEMANPRAIVQAAQDLGLTHIYLEVGSSGRGFYDQQSVDQFLPIAHQAGIKVIGWVLTSLNSLPLDLSICNRVASYHTPSGDRFDGIAPDIEDTMDAPDVAAFSQILRAEVGPDRLIVGVIYPAGTWIGRRHPIAAILSHSFNALAPMDYWHDTKRPYSPSEIADFIQQSVRDIQQAVNDPQYPVTVIGQTYDSFGRDAIGPNNPTGPEISAALNAAKQGGAVGVSLFQWGTTTPEEWEALARFHWSP